MITETILASGLHDGYGWHHGGGGPWFLLFPLFWIAVIVTLGVIFGRRRRAHWGGRQSAEATLRDRYAKGEIADEEYQARLRTLREK
ncbi:SHOCT domain-containing protein [Phytomonospora sp. NPDC050363]|uniref:SHOCT domain-containing protein n=1 Tax=Phytomonospora sp. NPDC050363 TaxID=3155642 RepID=UPI0033DD0005